MIVYLAGPMSGWVDFNVPVFDAVAELLRNNGHTVFNPADNGRGEPPREWDWYMRRGLGQLVLAEVIALLPYWFDSRGARFERSIGDALGLRSDEAHRFLRADQRRAYYAAVGTMSRVTEQP